jgi:hypothetical protein
MEIVSNVHYALIVWQIGLLKIAKRVKINRMRDNKRIGKASEGYFLSSASLFNKSDSSS